MYSLIEFRVLGFAVLRLIVSSPFSEFNYRYSFAQGCQSSRDIISRCLTVLSFNIFAKVLAGPA